MSGNTAKLRSAARRDGLDSAAPSQVGRDITADLRRLQSSGSSVLDVDGVVGGLAPALSGLLAAGHFCTLSITRDGRAVRLSLKDGKAWLEFYSSDPDHAEDLGRSILDAVQGSS